MFALVAKLKAGAGPHDPGSKRRGDGSELNTPIKEDALRELELEGVTSSDDGEVMSTDKEFEDPLVCLAEYIFENSDADSALVHDNDWAALHQMETHSAASGVSRLLETVRPEIFVDQDGVGCLVVSDNQPQTSQTRSTTTQSASTERTTPKVNVTLGFTIERISPGDGVTFPKKGDKVTIHFVGTLLDGSKFDSSRDRGTPFQTEIGVGKVIKGWDEGIPQLSLGERAVLTVKPHFGYGARGLPPVIPPQATLVFEVELLGIN